VRTAEEVVQFQLELPSELDEPRACFEVECFAAGIPRSFWDVSSKDVTHNKEIFQRVISKYTKRRRKVLVRGWGLVLMGDNGSGKTMFSSYIATQFLRRGTSVYYTTLVGLNEDFKKGFSDPGFSARLETALEAEFLILDELGKELRADGHLGVRLEQILKQRYDDARPTVLATNLSWGELIKRYGTSIESMLEGRYVKVPLASGDYRKITKHKLRKDLDIDV
jgi:DNA replication protein DnaC